jgi:low temperature requirement protein LtrA
MAAMFVIALAIPEAFHDLPGGLPGPIVIAIAYFVFRAMHLWMFWLLSDGDPVLRRTVLRIPLSMVPGTALLLVASQLHGGGQTLLWGLALLVDAGGTYLIDPRGWRLRSAAHFAERHGLIVIIALGESIVAIGVGVTDLPISWPILITSVLGLAVSSALWWIYFDATAYYGEQALANEPAETQPKLARDAYTFLHFPNHSPPRHQPPDHRSPLPAGDPGPRPRTGAGPTRSTGCSTEPPGRLRVGPLRPRTRTIEARRPRAAHCWLSGSRGSLAIISRR